MRANDQPSANRDKDNGDGVGRGPIRVWRVGLDRSEQETAALGALLSADEHARADRFRFDRDRRHFTVARGTLRDLLGRTLGVPGGAIEFAYGNHGKPALRQPAATGLEFNLSHSNGLALIAVCTGRHLGVDIEYHRPELDFRGIAGRFFTPWESGQILAEPEDAQRSAFFRGWTRKEAFLKARGDGLWLGLDQFEVSIDPAHAPRLVRTVYDPDDAARWTLHDLEAPPGFSAALVVEGTVSDATVIEVII